MIRNYFYPKVKTDPHYLQTLWEKEFEDKSLWGNRTFCFTFLIGYPLTSILYYLNGNPDYQSILMTQLACSCCVSVILFLHFKGKINGQNASFFSRMLLILFHSFVLARFDTIYFYDMNINLTLQLIFSVWVLRWRLSYGLISSAMTILAFSIALHMNSPDIFARFLKEGGFFYFLGQAVFPLILQIRYNKQYHEFVFLHHLEKQNQELEKQNQLVREATQAKSDFLSMMSHEIRTPLNGIVGVVHLLLEENPQTKFQRELAETLKFSSDHLMAVVNNVLDFNKINSNHVKLSVEPFDMVLLLKNLERTFISRAQEKKLDLLFEIDPMLPGTILGDKVRLNQVITNLIHNAVKFTDKGFVQLRVLEKGRNGDRVKLLFEVSDSGIGIPPEEQSTIFEIFTQSISEVKKGNRGSGLGLAITREILRLFESEITLVSEPGKGSVFSFAIEFQYTDTLPVAVQNTEMQAIAPDAKILVVDDNLINILVATNLLKKVFLQYDTAENGRVALEKFSQDNYSLILMDLKMPVMNGFEAARIIRAQGSQVPIVALTASAFTDEREKALMGGFSAYLAKPFLPKDFYDLIFSFLISEEQKI